MSDQLALDILKVVVPVVSIYLAWMQKQINDNRRYLEKMLDECYDNLTSKDKKQQP